jgi:hypothetical protein
LNATGGNITFTNDDGVLIADSTVTSLGTLSFDFGTVKYNAPIAGQLIVVDIYKHLQVSDVLAIKTLSGIVDVRGDLTIDTGVTTAMGDHDLTVTGTTTIPGIVTINNATLDANNSFDASGGTITFTGAGDLQLGGAVVTSLGPNLTNDAGTVTYDFAGGQTIVEDAYFNLVAQTGSGTKTLGGKVTVNGDLTIASGNILALGADTLDVTAGATAIAGGLTIGASGVLDADGTFTAGGGTIALTGTGSMELSGAVVPPPAVKVPSASKTPLAPIVRPPAIAVAPAVTSRVSAPSASILPDAIVKSPLTVTLPPSVFVPDPVCATRLK